MGFLCTNTLALDSCNLLENRVQTSNTNLAFWYSSSESTQTSRNCFIITQAGPSAGLQACVNSLEFWIFYLLLTLRVSLETLVQMYVLARFCYSFPHRQQTLGLIVVRKLNFPVIQ